jgi:hypothetical protein
MPYVSKAEKEASRWMTLQQGSEHVQFVDACDEDEAIKQLILAIAEGGLRAQWGIGRRAAANEFRNRVLVYPLEGTSVHIERGKATPTTFSESKIEIVRSLDDNDFAPLHEPLWVLREDISSIWPKTADKHPPTESRQAEEEAKEAAAAVSSRQKASADADIRTRLRKIRDTALACGEKMPNVNKIWGLLKADGVHSKRTVFTILKEEEFDHRRSPGERNIKR